MSPLLTVKTRQYMSATPLKEKPFPGELHLGHFKVFFPALCRDRCLLGGKNIRFNKEIL